MRFIPPRPPHKGCFYCARGEWAEHHEPRPAYRVWADGREFGTDYIELSTARMIAALYSTWFPRVDYRVRDLLGRFA